MILLGAVDDERRVPFVFLLRKGRRREQGACFAASHVELCLDRLVSIGLELIDLQTKSHIPVIL